MPQFEWDVYLSYCSADKTRVASLAARLAASGLRVWFDRASVDNGRDIVSAIERGLENSRVLVLCMTTAAFESEWVSLERNTAVLRDPDNRNRRFVALLMDDCKIPDTLRRLKYVDWRDESDSAWRELLAALMSTSHLDTSDISDVAPIRRVFNVPYLQNLHFRGRPDLLTKLESKLSHDHNVAILSPYAIHGLGGVGKTQIAVEYAYRHRNDYRIIWWLRAEFAYSTLVEDYAALGYAVGLASTDGRHAIDTTRRWLEANDGWLLIFDNVEKPEVIRNLLPRSAHGHVIVTSRNPNWDSLCTAIPIAVFSLDESAAYLSSRLGPSEGNTYALLATSLGNLPLALDQAASYILETRVSVTTYITMFRTHQAEMLRRGAPTQGYDNTVATTWDLAFDRIHSDRSASDLLILIAYCNTDVIPRTLFSTGSQLLPESLRSTISFNDAIATLRSFSSIDATPDLISMHRLVRAIIRHRQPKALARRFGSLADALYAQSQRDASNASPLPPGENVPDSHSVVALSGLHFSLKHVYYTYDSNKHAVCDLSVDFHVGTVTALIGPSGCGKSALLKAIVGLRTGCNAEHIKGLIDIGGGAPRIAWVIDSVPLSMVAYDFIAVQLRSAYRMNATEIDERIQWSAKLLGVNSSYSKGVLERNMRTMAHTEQVLVDVIKAIAFRPQILLLDTCVTSSFSPAALARLEDAIHTLKGTCTVVWANHDMRSVARVSDYAVFMLAGRVVEFGPTKKLLVRPDRKETEDFMTGRFG